MAIDWVDGWIARLEDGNVAARVACVTAGSQTEPTRSDSNAGFRFGTFQVMRTVDWIERKAETERMAIAPRSRQPVTSLRDPVNVVYLEL